MTFACLCILLSVAHNSQNVDTPRDVLVLSDKFQAWSERRMQRNDRRQGHWLVLDELNLAPTDVLEALNRLLDDNRELFVPELNEMVTPHPHFCLFATQNPPGAYAGRKALSRAFRNRFCEMHVGDIPDAELQTILHTRCQIAPSYAAKMILVRSRYLPNPSPTPTSTAFFRSSRIALRRSSSLGTSALPPPQ